MKIEYGQDTSVTAIAVGGAIAFIVVWLLGFYQPALMAAAPVGVESAIGTIITAALCYFLPTFMKEEPTTPSKEGGFARYSLLAILAFFASVALVACSALNPLGAADSVEKRAYAAYGTFVLTEELVADLVDADSSLEDEHKRRLIAAHETAAPAVDRLLEAYQEYLVARADFEAGRIDASAFDLVIADLESWVNRASDLVEDLRRLRHSAQ